MCKEEAEEVMAADLVSCGAVGEEKSIKMQADADIRKPTLSTLQKR